METKRVTEDMRQQLRKHLPPEAVKPHPTKTYLSTIRDIYVIERLNEVFGVGSWKLKVEHITTQGKMVVVKVLFTIPEYNIEYECYGGNDNSDLGDAYKGATTDALTKICSWLGIANEVWKNKTSQERTQTSNPTTRSKSQTKRKLTIDSLMDERNATLVAEFIHNKWLARKKHTTTYADIIQYYYECNEDTLNNLIKEIERKYATESAQNA